MKQFILTLALVASFTAIKAQGRVKSDTTHRIVNPDDLKTDSVKKGQEVYLPGKNQPDKDSQKQKPKKKPATGNKEATKPK